MSERNVTEQKRRRSGRKRIDWPFVGLAGLAVILLAAILCVLLTRNSDTPEAPTEPTPPAPTQGDTVAPVLTGVHNFTVYQGDTIAYYKGISATDNEDPNPMISVDNSTVDLSRVGVYEVTYVCTDESGNETRVTATVTVLEKKENYADLETIYAAVDAKLAKIITEGMTTQQKVVAIYNWTRTQLGYKDNFDHSDYRQAAYIMLTQARGDCFGFFAVTKLMFERLEIPNIDVRKVKDSTTRNSDHFWSLVSIDGGVTWYHFDSTPFQGEGDNFCLVTDAFLDAYSASHKNSHNRDKSLYPATP